MPLFTPEESHGVAEEVGEDRVIPNCVTDDTNTQGKVRSELQFPLPASSTL